MRGSFTVLASALALLVGCTDPAPRVATTVDVTPDSLTFDAVGESAPMTATVKDQFGDVLPNAAVRWTLINGHNAISPSDTARVVSIRSLTTGKAAWSVASGAAKSTFIVTVSQRAATMTKDIGRDNQSGRGGTLLPLAISVSVRDRNGYPISPYDRVLWTADAGGQPVGVFGPDNIGGLGVNWKLGPATTPIQHLMATVAGVGSVTFTATAF